MKIIKNKFYQHNTCSCQPEDLRSRTETLDIQGVLHMLKGSPESVSPLLRGGTKDPLLCPPPLIIDKARQEENRCNAKLSMI